ncbi:MAG TPA: M20 aminoacylase family protein [Inquilinus sp.]
MAGDGIAAGVEAHREAMVVLRRDLHRHPELAYRERRTGDLVTEALTAWGYEVHRGLGGTGVVGTLALGDGPRRVGIRADMDALPIVEATNLPYASGTEGVMHACGHDGHTASLLAAARVLAERRGFSGTLHLIFQPAEEGGAGARRMIRDGLFERFPCDAVYGLHNWPGVPAGQFGFITGPAMAAADRVTIRVVGKGGHGAVPQQTVDPVVASASLVMALQSVVSRNVSPLDAAVVTVGAIHGGQAANVIPDAVELRLTVRTFKPEVREGIEARITALARAQAESYGATAEIEYLRGYPVLVNHAAETDFARQVAAAQFGADRIQADFPPITASEDFAYMLEERPGSYLYLGNGDSAALHSPNYNFNDEILPVAARYWVALAERYLAAA